MLKLTRARLCANHPEQHAIRVALEGDQSHLVEMNAILKRRAALADQMLNQVEGISLVRPGGAFYAYPSLYIKGDDADFVRQLILDTGVVVVPGSGFGQRPGTAHFRFVTLPDDETLRKAFERIADFVTAWRAR
jgi:alanine-synthesizing transaminase